jgi:hypothetical protein
MGCEPIVISEHVTSYVLRLERVCWAQGLAQGLLNHSVEEWLNHCLFNNALSAACVKAKWFVSDWEMCGKKRAWIIFMWYPGIFLQELENATKSLRMACPLAQIQNGRLSDTSHSCWPLKREVRYEHVLKLLERDLWDKVLTALIWHALMMEAVSTTSQKTDIFITDSRPIPRRDKKI